VVCGLGRARVECQSLPEYRALGPDRLHDPVRRAKEQACVDALLARGAKERAANLQCSLI
jgi:hypothetical protein